MSTQETSRADLWRENVRQAVDVIRAHRMRSALLIVGVAIGITTILAMVTVMTGLVAKINKDLQSSSRPYLFVTRYDVFVSEEEFEKALRRKKLTPEDARAIEDFCPSADRVCYFVSRGLSFIAYYKDRHTPPVELDGASHTMPDIFSIAVEHGRFFSEAEISRRERVAVLGYGPAKDLFGHENPIGKHVEIENRRYRVIGTFANREHFIGAISNNFIAIPYTVYQKDFQTENDDMSIAANAKEGASLEQLREEIIGVMRARRGVKAGEENNFWVTTSTAFLEIVGRVTFAISAVLVIIASIGLLVGGIGVMNIMLISVAERTREIGVRMALGATRRDVMQQFLTESAALTGIGGLVGTAFGLGAAYLISQRIHFPFQFSLAWTVIAIVFSALVGIVFGIYPARRAARLNPVDALRYE